MNRTSTTLLGLGLILALIAGWGFSSLSIDAGDAEAVVQELVESSSDPQLPETSAPTTFGPTAEQPRWQANPETRLGSVDVSEHLTPIRLRIETLGIDAPIGAYGVDRDGQMDVPNNITDVGWYKYGASPGESGSAVLAAHVDLRGPGRGLFWDLDELEPGSYVVVEYSDGSEMTFEVTARSLYQKDELPLDAIFSEVGPPVVTLITCGGGFSRSEGSYDSNVVVYAVPVASADLPPAAS